MATHSNAQTGWVPIITGTPENYPTGVREMLTNVSLGHVDDLALDVVLTLESPLVTFPLGEGEPILSHGEVEDRVPNKGSGFTDLGVMEFGDGQQNLVYVYPKDYAVGPSGDFVYAFPGAPVTRLFTSLT